MAEHLPYNPVVEQCDLILGQLHERGGLLVVGSEKDALDGAKVDKVGRRSRTSCWTGVESG